MPITVHYDSGSGPVPCVLRPAPFISINPTPNRLGNGDVVGMNYDITLTGVILACAGSPFGVDNTDGSFFDYEDNIDPSTFGPYNQFYNGSNFFDGVNDNRPPRQNVPIQYRLDSVISKQKAINALFAVDGQKVEISSVHGDGPEGIIFFNPVLNNINYSEGIYTDQCNYTISLQANALYGRDGELTLERRLSIDKDDQSIIVPSSSTDSSTKKYFISNYDEAWSLDTDEARAETQEEYVSPRTYSVTHTVSAIGKTHYTPDGTKLKAWEEAKKFVQEVLMVDNDSEIEEYPNQVSKILGSGILNIDMDGEYSGYNRVVQENIDESGGTYSLSETFLLSKESAYEDYTISVSKTSDEPYHSVNIDGSIKGLSKMQSKEYVSNKEEVGHKLPIYYANQKWDNVSQDRDFGVNSELYKRCNTVLSSGEDTKFLNPEPLSQSYSVADVAGEISYSVSYNNRPLRILSGTSVETISIQDTYPGDVFSVIPVIGRKTGPVLQYMGSKSEYKRSVNIDVRMDYGTTYAFDPSLVVVNLENHDHNFADFVGDPLQPTTPQKPALIARKPSIVEPTRTELQQLLMEVSPANEIGIKKYLLAAPVENWEPTSGNYSLQIEWTYELGEE